MSHYVVTETSFEYNDEVYHTGDHRDGVGMPVKVFRSKAKAEAYVKEQSIKQIRGCNGYGCLGCYGYGYEEITNDPEAFVEFWKELTGEELDDGYHQLEVPDNITDEQAERLYGLLSLKFFNLVEVS